MSGSDVILAEVVRHGLQSVAEEMGAALIRTAHSVNIRDRRDFSCGVFTADGLLAAQAEHIPVHLGLLVGMVERLMERTGEAPPPGTTLVTNDPWISGSHLPDVVLVTPVDDGGTRVGYVANMAHQVDLGGLDPGSLSLGAREVFQEGLCLPPLALIRDGELDHQVVEVFRVNSRTPEVIVGDLLAQAAANSTGARRLTELVRRIGRERLDAAVATLRRATAQRLAGRIADLPRTPATFTDVLEWHEGERDVDLVIRVTVTPHDDAITIDFTGTDDQVPGPVNANRLLTTSCVLYVLKAMLDPGLASNAGLLDPVRIVTERGTLVDAERPAAVGMCTSITSQRICDVLLGAFNHLRPGQEAAASTGSMNALIVGGVDPRRGTAFSYVETYGGGQGALCDLDGADGVHTHMTNTSNTPVEIIERTYPLKIRRYGLIDGSGGAGRYRGGHGLTREIELETEATVTIHLDRTRHRPWGVAGGESARGSSAVVIEEGRERLLPGKCTITLPGETVVAIRTAGGGGWGPPEERAAHLERRDIREDLLPGGTGEKPG